MGARVDLEALAQQEKEALDFYFKDEEPFLTVEVERQLRERFGAALAKFRGENSDRSLPSARSYV